MELIALVGPATSDLLGGQVAGMFLQFAVEVVRWAEVVKASGAKAE